MMTITNYEGGIAYKTEIPDPRGTPRFAAFERFLDSIPCSCRGEAHDECHPTDEEE